jgi:hypothetical protein
MAGVQGQTMSVAVVIPESHLTPELMEKFEIIAAEITTALRGALIEAGAALTNSEEEQADTAAGAPQQSATPDAVTSAGGGTANPLPDQSQMPKAVGAAAMANGQSARSAVPSEIVGKRFLEGLRSIKRPGSSSVSLVTNGKPVVGGAMRLFTDGGRQEPVRELDPASQMLTGFVHAFSKSGKCRIKRVGSTAQVDADFPTDDMLSLILRFACDGPPVEIKYRPYKDADGNVVSLRISQVLGLSAPWAGVTGAFANLARAMDAMKKLLPRGGKSE